MKKLLQSTAFKWIATIGFILFLIVAILLIARALLIDYIADTPRIIMPDAEYEEMQHFFSTPVQLDESVYEVEPYPADLIESASRFQKLLQMNERSLLNLLSENGILKAYVSLRKEIPYSNENINAIQAIQQKYEHIFVAAHQMVDHPEYDLLVLTKCGSPSIDIINNNLELFHNTTLVLKLSASLQSSEKDWENAFDTYNILLNVCKHSAYTPVNLQRIMNRNIITTLQLIVSSSNDCENIILLEEALQKMAQLEPYMFHETLREPFLTDIVAALRVRKHLNYAVKFEKGMYGWELFEQYRYFRITIFMSDDWQQLSPELFREKLRNNKKIDGHWTNESILGICQKML